MLPPFKYPAYDSFVDAVKLEAEQNVKRLRHHPSLVVWGSLPSRTFSIMTHTVHAFQLETTKVPSDE